MADSKSFAKQNERSVYEHPIPAVRARQGVISGRVSLVLAVSLALVIVAFALIYTLH